MFARRRRRQAQREPMALEQATFGEEKAKKLRAIRLILSGGPGRPGRGRVDQPPKRHSQDGSRRYQVATNKETFSERRELKKERVPP